MYSIGKEGKPMTFLQAAKQIEDDIIAIRRDLHLYPEIALQEKRTIEQVVKHLELLDVQIEIIPNGGIIATMEGNKRGKTLILRADLDALPIEEAETNLQGKKQVVSKNKGAAHLCGHDGHTAMLLGAAKILHQYRENIEGNVIFAFEQAEENGQGIYRLLQRLVEIGADGVWGIHLKSDIPSKKVSVEAGPRMAGVLPFAVKIHGKGGHGSRPDLAHSPVDCFHDFYEQIQLQQYRNTDPFQPVTISVGSVLSGSKDTANVIPNTLIFNGTGRFLHKEQGVVLEEQFKQALETACAQNNCTYEWLRPLKALPMQVYNEKTCAGIAKEAVISSLGEEALTNAPAWMASEPFSFYQKYFPGVFAFLGIKNEAKGTGAEHHNEHFDIDEDVLHLGTALTVQYVFDFLNSDLKINYDNETKDVTTLFTEYGLI